MTMDKDPNMTDPWAGQPDTDKTAAQDTDAPTWLTALDAANARAATGPTDNDEETADRVTYAESTCPLCDHALTRSGACPNESYAWHL